MTNTASKPQSIREFITENPIGSKTMLFLCEKHGVSLDSPWPPRFPKEEREHEPRKEQAKVVQLQFWGEDYRAAPNAVFRSALFPALRSNEKESRRFLKNEEVFCVAGLKILFTGEQFDQSDLDVYLELLNMAQPFPLGTPVKFSAYALLKALSLPVGGSNHARLHAVLIRLRGGTLDITDHKTRYFGGLIEGGFRDEITLNYEITLNPKFAALFGFGMWSKIDLEKRHALGRNNTAKALYGYYATHINPTAHNFETLANIAGLINSNKRQVKSTIIKAHTAMKEVEILNNYTVTAETIKADIIPTDSQAQAIIKKDRKVPKASSPRRNEPTPATAFFTGLKTEK